MSDSNDLSKGYLNAAMASAHGADWFLRRFLVYVPSDSTSETTSGADTHLTKALHSVVDVVEAPFLAEYSQRYVALSDFVIAEKTIRGRYINQVHNFYKVQKARDEVASDFRYVQVSNCDKPSGLYFGLLVAAPPSSSTALGIPRGRVYIRVTRKDGTSTPTLFEPSYGPGGPPVGLYLGQDRMIFQSTSHLKADLPMALSAPQETDEVDFLKEKAIAILPPNEHRSDPLVGCFALKTPLNADVHGGDVPPIQSLISSGSGDNKFETLPVTSKPSDATLVTPLDQVLGAIQTTKFSADLVIEPDTGFACLRHDPQSIDESYFEVLGVILPTPIEKNNASELNLFFNSNGHFVAHALEATRTAVKIKPRRHLIALDQAQIVDSSGTWVQTKLKGSAQFEDLGQSHQICLLRSNTRLPWRLENPTSRKRKQWLDARPLFNGERDLYCLTRKGVGKGADPVFGYIGCPLMSYLPPNDPRIDTPEPAQRGRPGCKPANINYQRNKVGAYGSDAGQSLCLDWLDEAIKLVPLNKDEKVQGLAEYWSTRFENPINFGLGRQSLHMVKFEDSSYRLELREDFGDDTTHTALTNNTVIRLGPLICRYRCPPSLASASKAVTAGAEK